MFNFFKKKKRDNIIYCPCTGSLVRIEEVNDEVFSGKHMGEGFAVRPDSGEIYSPVTGTIMSVFPTKHALGIKTENGCELLIHVGLDTVDLEGEPFKIFVSEGDKVNEETKLLDVDLRLLERRGRESDVIIVFPAGDKTPNVSNYGKVSAKEMIGELN